MIVDWDEPKRLANLDKHGLDFADVIDFGWDEAVIIESHSGRLKAIGLYDGATAVVVFSMLGTEAISIISFRWASARERRLLDERGG